MADGHEQTGGSATQEQPSDEEMRAAYEAELNRITSSEMILQTTVSLLNIGGRRLGMGSSPATSAANGNERDLEQVRDAIDGASALLPILERRMPRELGPLRDAIAQLQVAYAREASAAASQGVPTGAPQASAAGKSASETAESTSDAPVDSQAPTGGEEASSGEDSSSQEDQVARPGPAQASGRLWVPGR